MRLAVSAATLRRLLSGWFAGAPAERAHLAFRSDRTSGKDAQAAAIVARDAIGTSPISAAPEASWSAHSDGSIQSDGVARCELERLEVDARSPTSEVRD